MNLNDYQWSNNPRGMHWDTRPVNLDILQQHGMGWVKIVSLGGPSGAIGDAPGRGITPIIRMWRERPGNSAPPPSLYTDCQAYLALGMKWFELYNEPNLFIEWPEGANFNPREPGVIGPLCDNWLNWAEFIVNAGGYPGITALSEGDGEWEFNGLWIERMLLYHYENHYERFRQVLNNGCWIATHPGVLNHFYQEEPGGGPRSARPPETQNWAEPGWHFEYPYDPINKHYNPNADVWAEPKGEPLGLIASGIAFHVKLAEMFGVGAIPVVGTEGGIFAPNHRLERTSWDDRYPPFTWESHAHATIAMFDWIIDVAPPWMFGVTIWTENDFWHKPDGPVPALDFFRRVPPRFKAVPPLPALDRNPSNAPGAPSVFIYTPGGPGPVHGEPDYHFIYLAPGVDWHWFFDEAQVYVDLFRPTLLHDLDFIDLLTYEKSLALTVIAPPENELILRNEIVPRWRYILVDMLPVGEPGELGRVLNARVQAQARLG